MQVPHVFIDTAIFIGQNYNYDSAAFRQIVSLAQDEKLFIYITTVTLKEVEAHIEMDVVTAHQAFEGFRNKQDLRILSNIIAPPLHGIFKGFDVLKAKEALLDQFRVFLQKARVHVLEITNVSVDQIFDRYFSLTPPFSDKKKNEFPDAFSLAAVEQWCKESSGRMYVVSSDPDWSSACELNQSLRSFQSLSEFLDFLSRGEELAELANTTFEAHRDEIVERIKQAVDPLNLIYEPYGEVQSSFVDSARILKHYLIEVDEAKAIFDVVTEVSYSANVLYHNYALRMMMGGIGAREELEYGSTNVRTEVSIALSKENQDKFSIASVEIKNEAIYIFPDEDPEDFGRKYTKAQKALPGHVQTIAQLLGGLEWIKTSAPEKIIESFETLKTSVPIPIILDLKTLNMLNPLSGGLNYQGAMTIKDKAGRNKQPASSSWLVQDIERRRSLYGSQVNEAVRAAREFGSPMMRQATEAARALTNPHILQAVKKAALLDRNDILHAVNAAKMFDSPAISQAVEAAKSLRNSVTFQAFENARLFASPAMAQAAEAARLWQRNPLSGQLFSQHMLVDISPRRLSDLSGSDSSQGVEVEVLLNTEVYGSREEERVEDVARALEKTETPAFDFDNFPLTITLTHRTGTPNPYRTAHRLRKPSSDEWEEWALELDRTRRYLSPEEIAEDIVKSDEDEEAPSEVWSPSYSEWQANEHFYNRLILEVSGFHLDKDDEFPSDEFRTLPPEIIERLAFEIKSSVISKLYRSYCELEGSSVPSGEQSRVHQHIDHDSSSFDVVHILRNPTQDESYDFRTNIVRGYFATDEENREVIKLKLNLPSAIHFYDRLLLGIKNATVGGRVFSGETRSKFLEAINPVHKLRVIEPLFDVNAWYFGLDDLRIP